MKHFQVGSASLSLCYRARTRPCPIALASACTPSSPRRYCSAQMERGCEGKSASDLLSPSAHPPTKP
eukprot:2842115-Rhodomonas_salina.1